MEVEACISKFKEVYQVILNFLDLEGDSEGELCALTMIFDKCEIVKDRILF